MQQGTWKTVQVTIGVLVAVALAASLGILYSGAINVGATIPHFALTKWVLGTAMEHSVERHSRHISPPAAFPGDAMGALPHFDEMCALCHGAPGKEPSDVGKGLRPGPPKLAEVAKEMPDAQVFWVVKNGIRMTGMPAFGVTHSDGELWELVAAVKKLPQLKPEEYRNGVNLREDKRDRHAHSRQRVLTDK